MERARGRGLGKRENEKKTGDDEYFRDDRRGECFREDRRVE